MFELFNVRKVGLLGPTHQIAVITILTLLSAAAAYYAIHYNSAPILPVTAVALMFAPIKEEIIFRGFILRWFEIHHSRSVAIWSSSLMFGLWHVQNVFAMEPKFVLIQVIYTTLFGMITARVALHWRTIWPGVILHGVTNLIALTSFQELFTSFLK